MTIEACHGHSLGDEREAGRGAPWRGDGFRPENGEPARMAGGGTSLRAWARILPESAGARTSRAAAGGSFRRGSPGAFRRGFPGSPEAGARRAFRGTRGGDDGRTAGAP
ncbi:hypothetical protein F3J18_21020 [Burkholderia sp. Ax-1720]|uniref:hypothetical protein n=1 Tax=Burkholderia sp. Ax-1720 TaxID=2608335 RepID=UPI001421A541|nr:hypothetical protein [Burkholderia sp. Ax-1720]NIF97708.1 hypothetical protein [Burkholderia sp. Ax-1720]